MSLYYMNLLVIFLAISLGSAFAEQKSYWNLPQQLGINNSEALFEVDTTWHLVEGKAKDISGNVWLADPADFKSIQAKITIPVKSLDTDNSSRDENMRDVMAESQFPLIEFKLNRVKDICSPENLDQSGNCNMTLEGLLNIRGVEKNISIPANISKTTKGYQIKATTEIDWSEFGVEDPSILIAKVQKTVKISILVNI